MVAIKTYMAKPGEVDPKWWLVDAENKVVGRLASDIAMILMGKHRPTYTPHVDTGDFVIVVNAEKIEFSMDKVQKILRIAKTPLSLETPVGGEDNSSLCDFIEDKRNVGPGKAAINNCLREQTKRLLATLTSKEEKVLRMRFGIGEKADYTLEEVGEDFEVTRERIRQIEAKALQKMRHPARSDNLRSYIEG